METHFQPVGIVGLGLIGGSMGLALRQKGVRVWGFERSPQAARRAVERGAADRTDGALRDCPLVLLAVYPGGAIQFVKEHLDDFAPGALLVDLCGTKRRICTDLEPICREKGLLFLGAHPMAGREISDSSPFALCSVINTT